MQRFFLVVAGVAIAMLTISTAEARFGRRGCSSCGSGGCYTNVDTGKPVQGPVQGPVQAKDGSPSDGKVPPPPPPGGGTPPPPPPGGAADAAPAPAAVTAAAPTSTNTTYTNSRTRRGLFRRG